MQALQPLVHFLEGTIDEWWLGESANEQKERKCSLQFVGAKQEKNKITKTIKPTKTNIKDQQVGTHRLLLLVSVVRATVAFQRQAEPECGPGYWRRQIGGREISGVGMRNMLSDASGCDAQYSTHNLSI